MAHSTVSEDTPLTDRQREVVRAIYTLAVDLNRWPTVRELAAELGIASPFGVLGHLQTLEKRGLLRRPAGKHRGASLVGMEMVLRFTADTDGKRLRRVLEGE